MHDPSSVTERQQIFLLLLCFTLPVTYTYNYDLLQALQQVLERPPFSLSLHQFNLAYTLTNSPAIITCILGGIIIDRWGVATCTVLFQSGMLLSTIGFWLSIRLAENGNQNWYYLMIASRLLLGTFGENAFALQSVILSCHVDIYRLTLYLGLGVNVAWLFEAFNNVLSPFLYEQSGSAQYPALVGGVVGLCCWGCGFALIQYERMLTHQRNQFIINEKRANIQKFTCSKVKQLGGMFFLLLTLVFLLECSYSPFIDNANDMLVQRQGFTYRQAGYLMFIPMTASFLSTPLWAWIDQRYPYKRRVYFLISLTVGLSLTLQLDIMKGGNFNWPLQILALSLLGIGISGNYTILGGSIPLIVEEENLGTAFGLICSVEAMGMSIAPAISAWVISMGKDRESGYTMSILLYIGVTIMTVVVEIVIKCKKGKAGRMLDGDDTEFEEWQESQLPLAITQR